MREILFRGKRIDNGEWIEGSLINDGRCFIAIHPSLAFGPTSKDEINGETLWGFYPFFEVDPSTTGQYTGLTDKNGKKIIEGDIVNAYNEINGCIKFGEYKYPYEVGIHLGFYVEWENQYGYSSMRKDLGYWKDKIEVIGNATDNPELLEAGE